MRDPARIKEFCDKLAEVWETKCPDWRFTQLVENVLRGTDAKNKIPFYIEDEDMMNYIMSFFNSRI